MADSLPQWPPYFYEFIPTDQLPVGHRPATVLGLIVSFQILLWTAVAFRLYCASLAKRGFGWDDLFVVLSASSSLITTVVTGIATGYGMGQHYGFVMSRDSWLIRMFQLYFVFSLCYFASSAFIKLSILFQYLRLFPSSEARKPRCVTIGVMVFVAVWGACFFFVQLFSCIPVSDAWNIHSTGDTCKLLLSWNLNGWLAGILVHTIINMALDYVVLLIPLLFRRHMVIESKGRAALLGLFGFGGCVATISAVRLSLIIAYRGGVHPTQDASWYAPEFIIPSVFEIDLAVICASVPIFWPILVQKLGLDQIRVTHEVILQSELRAAPSRRGWKRHPESSDTELCDLTTKENASAAQSEVEVFDHNTYRSDWKVAGQQVEEKV